MTSGTMYRDSTYMREQLHKYRAEVVAWGQVPLAIRGVLESIPWSAGVDDEQMQEALALIAYTMKAHFQGLDVQ